MKRGGSLKAGKKVKAWNSIRVVLKKEFAARGIVSCELRFEGCMGDDGLGFMHHLKRRHLKPEDMRTVLLACHKCHWEWERLGEAEMSKLVLKKIAERDTNS